MFGRHNWITVAFDEYKAKNATYGDQAVQVSFQKCTRTHQRRVLTKGIKRPHSLNIAVAAWVDHNYLLLKTDGDVIDDDYSKSPKGISGRYDFRPLNGIEEMVEALRNDPKFKKVSNHQMVADAMEELETVIKMHENLE